MDTSLCTPEAVATRVDAAVRKRLFKVLQLHVAPVECTHMQDSDMELARVACVLFGYPVEALDDVV